MSYISFYRKWRPQSFSEIIGQEHIVQTLRNSILNNKISHLYMFSGPRGTGKTSLARIFAKAINCLNGPGSDPCNKCANCISISAGTNVDVIEIDAASNRKIDDIRDIREKVKYLPVNLRKKVYIIDEVHQITSDASNAFLKVLEEPPEHVIFIMATTEPHEVIPTIMSRCQRFDFEPIKLEKIKMKILEIASSEGINISDSATALISKYADGSLRDAVGILDQLSSFGDSKVTVDNVTSLLGIVDQEMLFEFGNILLEKNISQGLLFVKRLMDGGLNLKVFVTEFLEHLYNLYAIKSYENPLDILDINEDAKDKYFNQAALLKAGEIEMYLDLFSELLKQIKWGDGAKTFFKTTIIKAIKSEIMSESNINSKFKKIDSELGLLKDFMEKPAVINYENKKEENTDQAAKNSNKAIAETVVKNIKEQEKPSAVKDIAEKPNTVVPPPVKKATDSADDEKLIRANWEKLLSYLKEKNISIQAMFKETESFKINSGTICFYLSENKKWHKDHLNKTKNAMLIHESLKEVTGRSLKVVFDFEPYKGSNNSQVENKGSEMPESGKKETSGISKNTEQIAEEHKDVENKDVEEIYEYIENKFRMKNKNKINEEP